MAKNASFATMTKAGGRAGAIAALAAIVSGCMVGPDYVRPSAPTPMAFKEMQGWKVAQPSDDAPRGNWWEAFGDADLNALEAQVDTANQTVQAAEANVRQARAATQAARAAMWPMLNGNGQALRSSRAPGNGTTNGSGVLNSYNLALDASWEIDLWGGTRRSIEASGDAAQATAGDLAAARLSAQGLLAQDYLLLRVQDAEIELLRENRCRLRTIAATDAQPVLGRHCCAGRCRAGGSAAQVDAGAACRWRDHARPTRACDRRARGEASGRTDDCTKATGGRVSRHSRCLAVHAARTAARHCRRRATRGQCQCADRRRPGGLLPGVDAVGCGRLAKLCHWQSAVAAQPLLVARRGAGAANL